MFSRFLLAAAVATILPPAAVAQPLADEPAVTSAIAHAVTTYSRFTIFDDVTLEVAAGHVTLRGKVTMPFKKEEIGRRAQAAAPGYTMTNDIDVLPVSVHDDALRQRVARAIYGNAAFWRQAAMANPPIHIIVERGRVTLTGVVPGEVDRALARSLASGLGELSLTSLLKTDAEVEAEAPGRPRRASLRSPKAP
jgi:hyperosmotically inducible periplasmic protein